MLLVILSIIVNRRTVFDIRMWIEVGFAALLRVLLSKTAAKTWLDDRVEISTPVTAWKRVCVLVRER